MKVQQLQLRRAHRLLLSLHQQLPAASIAPQEAQTASAAVAAATQQTQSVTDQVKQARMQGYEGESCPNARISRSYETVHV